MKNHCCFRSGLMAAGAVLGVIAGGSFSAQGQTYGPAAWVNDPFTTNANWTLTNPNTTYPIYTHTGVAFNGNLFGNSPIGTTITLANAGDSAVLSGQVTLEGSVNASGNVQYRVGLFYKGANPTDTGWAGYMLGNPTGGGGGGLYLRNIPNTGLYGSGTGTTQPALTGWLFSSGWGAATYDFMISVTKLSSTATLVRWKLTGLPPSTYNYSGRYTNNSAATQGGFSFDQVGFLSGGSVWTAAGGIFTYTNVLVTAGRFTDGSWTNDASGNWSTAGNWTNALAANGAGFVAGFDPVTLTADRTVTLDSSRTIGSAIFGATGGSLNNWILNASGGSTLTLDPSSPAAPAIGVNQNTATVNAPLISSNGLAKTGAGTLILRGANTIAGPLNLNGGALNFLSSANLSLSSITAINFGGGALQWASGNTFDISSLAIGINFAGNAGFDTGPNNVTLANGFGDSGAGGLTKLGSGTLTLGGPASYSGTTTISNGVLAFNSAGSLSGTTNITINSGATLNVTGLGDSVMILSSGQTLAGAGTVVGHVADGSGTIIAPGNSAGTLTVNGNLALNGGGALNFELSDVTTAGSGVNDLVAVTGTLFLAGPTTLNLSLLNGAPGLGTYTLFTYNTFSGDVANLTAPPGFVVTNDTALKLIGLTVTHVPAVLTWQGDGSANAWNTGTTPNWLQSGTNQVFFTGDSVTFDATGSITPPVDISGNVSPSAVTVNDSRDYTIYTLTTGGIATGRLTKSGTGMLTLETDNSYSGPTVINAGTLQVGGPNLGGASGTLGTGPTTNNAALVFNRNSDYTYANAIRGTGSITNLGSVGSVILSGSISGSTVNSAGSGTLVLSGSNTYTGQTIISAGSINPRASAALGTAAAGTIIQAGGRLYLDANIDFVGEAVSVAGTGPDGAGALRKGGNGVSTWAGAVTLAADASIAVDGGATLNLTNAAGIAGSGFNLTLGGGGNGTVIGPVVLGIGSLTKSDGGIWTVAPTNTYTGKTIINGGTLLITNRAALGQISAFTPDFVTLGDGSLGASANLNFDDGLRGFTASGAAGGFNVGAGLTLVVSNEITGGGTITKSGSGRLVLNGPNTFSGTLNVDSGANALDDGILVVAHPQAIAAVTSPIAIRNTLGGSSSLQLDGTSGAITVSQAITLNGRSPAIPTIRNVVGNNILAGDFTLTGAGTRYIVQSDSGLLTLSGIISNATVTPQILTIQGNGNVSLTGLVQDDGISTVNVVKEGNGRLTLTGQNTSTGSTVVNGGVFGGTGTITGPVSISSGGTLAPGTSIGTLTINSNLTLAGTVEAEINANTDASDRVTGLTSVNYGGTLSVVNLAGTLNAGDTFQLFSAAASSGNFSSITGSAGAGMTFSFNPATGILSVVGSNPTLGFSLSGSTLTLSWPGSLGWILQAQTNSLSVGLLTDAAQWHDVAGSSSSTQAVVTIDPANPTVFYRLRNP